MDEGLIEEVRKRKFLYDPYDPDYKNSERALQTWEDIAKVLMYPNGLFAKNKWKQLRGNLRESMKRQKTTSGQEGKVVKKYRYQDQMSFVIPTFANRPQLTNLDSPSTSQIEEIGFDDSLEEDTNDTANNSGINLPTPPPAKKARYIKPKTIQMLVEDSVQRREERSRKREQDRAEKKSPLGTFFTSMYESTKRLNPQSQRAIRKLLFEAVLKEEEAAENFPPNFDDY